MTLQVLLSMVLGFGVLTLATVALLNAAGHRLHDLELLGKSGLECAFVYKYSSRPAANLRLWFSRLPWFLLFGALVAMACTFALHCKAVHVSEQEVDTKGTAMPVNWTWVTMALYVLVLLVVTTVMSRRLYNAINIFRRVPFSNAFDHPTS